MEPVRTIRQTILSDEAVKAVVHQSDDLPRRLAQARSGLIKTDIELSRAVLLHQELKDQESNYRAEVRFLIEMKTNGENKKAYSNDKQRDGATAEMLKDDKEYQVLCQKVKEASANILNHQLQVGERKNAISFLADQLRTNIAQIYLVQGLSVEGAEAYSLAEAIQKLTNTQVVRHAS